jgi:hypothetical protein
MARAELKEEAGYTKGQRKRHGAAALQDLADRVARNASRQRRGVRQPHAALTFVHKLAEFIESSATSALNSSLA